MVLLDIPIHHCRGPPLAGPRVDEKSCHQLGKLTTGVPPGTANWGTGAPAKSSSGSGQQASAEFLDSAVLGLSKRCRCLSRSAAKPEVPAPIQSVSINDGYPQQLPKSAICLLKYRKISKSPGITVFATGERRQVAAIAGRNGALLMKDQLDQVQLDRYRRMVSEGQSSTIIDHYQLINH